MARFSSVVSCPPPGVMGRIIGGGIGGGLVFMNSVFTTPEEWNLYCDYAQEDEDAASEAYADRDDWLCENPERPCRTSEFDWVLYPIMQNLRRAHPHAYWDLKQLDSDICIALLRFLHDRVTHMNHTLPAKFLFVMYESKHDPSKGSGLVTCIIDKFLYIEPRPYANLATALVEGYIRVKLSGLEDVLMACVTGASDAQMEACIERLRSN